MTKRISIICAIISLFVFTNTTLFAQENIVTLPNGKKAILHSDKTWEYYEEVTYNYDFSKIKDNQIPSFLRGGISANKKTIAY